MAFHYKPFLIGVAGGSGSGKTTFAKGLQRLLNDHNCQILSQDSYYHDQSSLFDKDGGKVNYDHPDSLDFKLLQTHVIELKSQKDIEVPIYDYTTHKRKAETKKMHPSAVIIVEGILILSQRDLYPLFDLRIFIETSERVRFQRRMARDVLERGRTEQGVRDQFINQVKPMHDQYVEPSKALANKIISGEEDFQPAYLDVMHWIRINQIEDRLTL